MYFEKIQRCIDLNKNYEQPRARKKNLKILTATSVYKYGENKAARTSYKFFKKIVDPYITMAHYSDGFPEKNTKDNNGEAILFEDLCIGVSRWYQRASALHIDSI